MSNDIGVGVVSMPAVGALNAKPAYLVCFDEFTFFLSIDKPDLLNGFIGAKGFFVSGLPDQFVDSDMPNTSDLQNNCNQEIADEKYISQNYKEIITQASKDEYEEVLIPWHTIKKIKSLAYKAK